MTLPSLLVRGVLAGALSFGAVSLGACAGPKLEQTGPVGIAPHEKNAWQAELREHTRRDEVYDWFVRQADARATLITPALRKAFLDARPEFQGRFADKTERELVALGEPDPGVDVESRPRPESEEQIIFFVSMYVTDQKNRDIGASYTIWNTLLSRGKGQPVRPIAIEPIQKSPAVTDIFPFADRFDDLYLVRFPLVDAAGQPFLAPGPEPLTLRIESALAALELQWTLVE